MFMNITQEDVILLSQSSRTVYGKLDILNQNFKTTGSLDGELISDSYSIDSASEVRKTANITLFVKDSSFTIGEDKKIWFDKYLRLSMGIYNLRTREINWYEIGLFCFVDANYSYNSATRELSLSLSDLYCTLNGERNGVVSGFSTKIEAGANCRDAMISTVTQLGGIRKYHMEANNNEIPYDLEFSTGTTVSQIISEIRDLYAGQETFFDNDTFVFQSYPTRESDPIVIDDTVMQELVISEQKNTSFKGVYNVIEVWGKCNETNTYTTDVSYSSGTYYLTNTAITELKNNEIYGFKASAGNSGNCNIRINGFSTLPVYGEGNEPLQAGRIQADKSYVVKYKSNGSQSCFYFMGEYQICGIAKLMSREPTAAEITADLSANPTTNIKYVVESGTPFGADQLGEIRNVLSGGEYSNIYSEDLAIQRAEYELWLVSDMQDSITLEMIEIPWLDVNQKIEYTSLNTGKTETYLIKSKSGSTTGGTMSLTCVRFQPVYPWL